MSGINELTITFTKYLDYIDDHYEYIISLGSPFENALQQENKLTILPKKN
jgi:hypothetical protein